MIYYTTRYDTMLYYTMLYCTILYHTMIYYTVPLGAAAAARRDAPPRRDGLRGPEGHGGRRARGAGHRYSIFLAYS